MTNAAIYTPGVSLTVVIGGRPKTVYYGQTNFFAAVEAYKEQDWDKLKNTIDVSSSIVTYGKGRTKVVGGVVYVDNRPLHNVLTNRILSMMSQGFNIDPMLKFLENLEQNPSHTAREELYLFLEANEIPLTEDGCFLAYKKVRADYRDIYSGSFSNRVGEVCEMPRRDVDDNRDRTCSYGLHFCSFNYLDSYGSSSRDTDRVVIVKINPKDVVSIPSDYNNAKGRTCKYVVVQEFFTWRTKVQYFDSPVYSSSGDKDYYNVRDSKGRFTRTH